MPNLCVISGAGGVVELEHISALPSATLKKDSLSGSGKFIKGEIAALPGLGSKRSFVASAQGSQKDRMILPWSRHR